MDSNKMLSLVLGMGLLTASTVSSARILPIDESQQYKSPKWIKQQIHPHDVSPIIGVPKVLAIGRGGKSYVVSVLIPLPNLCIKSEGVRKLGSYVQVQGHVVQVFAAQRTRPDPRVFCAQGYSVIEETFVVNGTHFDLNGMSFKIGIVDENLEAIRTDEVHHMDLRK